MTWPQSLLECEFPRDCTVRFPLTVNTLYTSTVDSEFAIHVSPLLEFKSTQRRYIVVFATWYIHCFYTCNETTKQRTLFRQAKNVEEKENEKFKLINF
jgi:hypothetical protein